LPASFDLLPRDLIPDLVRAWRCPNAPWSKVRVLRGDLLDVETDDLDVPFLVCAPTMEAPFCVAHTDNAYRAMLALLEEVDRFNAENDDAIVTVAIPGLCTGIGDMEPEHAAQQMAHAYTEWHRNRA
jgi:O-acetyl-ADP-ribose deacetylase (regulator of RNase III)